MFREDLQARPPPRHRFHRLKNSGMMRGWYWKATLSGKSVTSFMNSVTAAVLFMWTSITNTGWVKQPRLRIRFILKEKWIGTGMV
ncbi:protein ygiW (plasmid) [Salmonella enterica subsp. enterica serovar Enteritidis]|nr:protein ygiW [Salmonella enterica subsp. enterica serovar Enteritidis]